MTCEHFRKDRINRIYNKEGKLIEYDIACGICATLLRHYKYGIKTKDYEKKKTFKIKKFILDELEYKISILKELINL